MLKSYTTTMTADGNVVGITTNDYTDINTAATMGTSHLQVTNSIQGPLQTVSVLVGNGGEEIVKEGVIDGCRYVTTTRLNQ